MRDYILDYFDNMNQTRAGLYPFYTFWDYTYSHTYTQGKPNSGVP
jgi:hypothetical protein